MQYKLFTSFKSCSRKYYECVCVLCNILASHMIMMQYSWKFLYYSGYLFDMYIRDWGFVGPLDLKRPVVKSIEATADRLNNERLRALPLALIFKPELCVIVTLQTLVFVLARDKCTDLVVISIICFVFNKLLFIYIYC